MRMMTLLSLLGSLSALVFAIVRGYTEVSHLLFHVGAVAFFLLLGKALIERTTPEGSRAPARERGDQA